MRVGLRACLPLPDGPLVAFGLAGALVPELAAGTIVTARRVVTPDGAVVWEGRPVPVAGAREVVVCAAERVIDDAAERREIAARTGAVAVEMESAVLARRGRLVGCVRAIADGPERPVGRLGSAATEGGDVRWGEVLLAFAVEPRRAIRASRDATRALRALRGVAAELSEAGRPA